MKDNILDACAEYFKSNPVLHKLIEGFAQKYISLGYVGGTVVFHSLSPEQTEELEGFLQTNYHGKSSASVSAKRMQKVLDSSRFAGVELEDLINYFWKGQLITNKEKAEESAKEQQEFFRQLRQGMEGGASLWLKCIIEEKQPPYRTLIQKYNADKEKLGSLLRLVMKALNHLPAMTGTYEYLAVFAARITGNPHYFDEGSEGSTLLYYGVEYYLKQTGKQSLRAERSGLQQKQELLYAAGIIKDDISNYTIAYGIRAWDQGEKEHLGIRGFYEEKEPIQLSLYSISNLAKVKANQNQIFVVENPSILIAMVSIMPDTFSVMCVNGQPNLASIVLLDKLADAGTQLYYAGDFDPEGLLIADRLKRRYSSNLHLWKMDEMIYQKALSEESISEKRLKMLDKIQDEALKAIAFQMRKLRVAGYQEQVINEYQIR